MTAAPGWRHRPGAHWAVVGPTAAALLVGEAALPLAERIWPLLDSPAVDVDRVLDEMTRDGHAGLPSFALVEVTGAGLRVLVRGTALARVQPDGAEPRTLDGVGFRSWREDVVPDAAVAALTVAREQAIGPLLPLRGGIVRAGALELAGAAAAPEAAPIVPAPAEEAAVPEPAADPGRTLDESWFDAEAGRAATPAPEPEPVPAPVAPEPPAAEPERPADEYYDLVTGMTQIGSVEDAAVRPEEEQPAPPPAPAPAGPPPVAPPPATLPAAAPPAWGPPTTPPVASWPPPGTAPAPPPAPAVAPAPPRPAAATPPPAPSGPGLISSIPFLSPPASAPATPPPAPAPVQPAPPADEEAVLTVARVPGGATAASKVGALPAVVCPSGHANPPDAERCRICRADVSSAPQQWVERPVIGRLRFDGPPGTVPVTGPMVIGRAPRADRVSGDAVPTMVTVPSGDGDVSRSHLRVVVEGWHVMVVDLDTTNGTIVEDPNGESRRLRPDEEKMILPGSRVVLADTVGFVFEAAP
ncbi:FHA domain-containing protein [Blastococcus sp. SYSU D00820]